MRAHTLAVLLLGSGLLTALAPAGASTQTVRVEGVVRDTSGAFIPGAEVELRCHSFTALQLSDSAGGFLFERVPETMGTIAARARGFGPAEKTWNARSGGAAHLEIVLAPASVGQQVIVTATRTDMRLSDIAGSALLFSENDLETTAALTLDDALRQVPGFSLFRRSGSRTANPTSQGVSLRGLGASGASRAVVLEDGIPLNDPFGGWVYWGRVPRESVASIEVVRGGASSLYGRDALGGVIQFRTRPGEQARLSLESSYGNERTPFLSLWAGGRVGRWSAWVAAEGFQTDGYILVPESQRGRVDTPAGSKHAAVDLTVERRLRDQGRVFARGSFFDESRNNGTPLQTNATRVGQAALGWDDQLRTIGSVSLRLYGGPQAFAQTFSAVAANRMSESLTDIQHVPSQQMGGTVQWSRPAGNRQTLVAGVEAQEVVGASDEQVVSLGRVSARVAAGGRQRTSGIFGEDIFRFGPRWIITVGARFDHWRNFEAQSIRVPVAPPGRQSVTRFVERTETAFSPRLAILRELTKKVWLVASGYRAFRAPTLNELYRSFRVGNVVTLSNDALRAEQLTGGEAGASAVAFHERLGVRGTFFWSEVVNPISNVTLNVQPTLITRQRQNLGRTRSRGIELDAIARLSNTLAISGGYEFADATVVHFPSNTALEGLQIPQVPRQQLTFQVRYSNPSHLTVGVQGRFVGHQFDDDRNQFRLDRYFALDVLAARSVARGVDLFVAVENLLDQRYTVGLTPIPTLGPPLLARFGIRVHVPAR